MSNRIKANGRSLKASSRKPEKRQSLKEFIAERENFTFRLSFSDLANAKVAKD